MYYIYKYIKGIYNILKGIYHNDKESIYREYVTILNLSTN